MPPQRGGRRCRAPAASSTATPRPLPPRRSRPARHTPGSALRHMLPAGTARGCTRWRRGMASVPGTATSRRPGRGEPPCPGVSGGRRKVTPAGRCRGCHRGSGKAAGSAGAQPPPTATPEPAFPRRGRHRPQKRRHTRAIQGPSRPPAVPRGQRCPRRRLSPLRPHPAPAVRGPGYGAEVAGPLALVRLLLRGLLPGEPHLQQLLGPFEEVCTALLHGETTRQPTTTEIKRQPNCRPRPPPFAAAARAALLPPPGLSPSRAGFTFWGICLILI